MILVTNCSLYFQIIFSSNINIRTITCLKGKLLFRKKFKLLSNLRKNSAQNIEVKSENQNLFIIVKLYYITYTSFRRTLLLIWFYTLRLRFSDSAFYSKNPLLPVYSHTNSDLKIQFLYISHIEWRKFTLSTQKFHITYQSVESTDGLLRTL